MHHSLTCVVARKLTAYRGLTASGRDPVAQTVSTTQIRYIDEKTRNLTRELADAKAELEVQPSG